MFEATASVVELVLVVLGFASAAISAICVYVVRSMTQSIVQEIEDRLDLESIIRSGRDICRTLEHHNHTSAEIARLVTDLRQRLAEHSKASEVEHTQILRQLERLK